MKSIKMLVSLLALSTICMTDLYATIIHVPGDYSTISSAISAASPGDTIVVAAGVYNEHVVINVANLTLLGAQANVDARMRTYIPANESIITFATPAFGTGIVNIASPNVIFNGFTVQGDGTIVNSTGAIFAGDAGQFLPNTTTIDVTGLQLLNNIVQNNANGILVASIEPTPKTPNYLVQYNYLQNNSGDFTNGDGQGVFFNNSAGSVMTNVTVTENLFNGMETSASVNLANVTTATVSYNVMNQDNSIALFATTGVSIIGNVTTGATGIIPGQPSTDGNIADAIFVGFGCSNTTITDNLIYSATDNGINIYQGNSNITITDNCIVGNTFAGISLNSGGIAANSNITINNNNIALNTTGLNLGAGSYTSPPPLLDATLNYWNSALGPNYNGTSPGAGDLITDNNIPATQTVQYTPFLTTATPTVTASPSSQTISSGRTTSIALSSNVPGSTFSWTVVESGVTGATAGSGALIAQILTTTTTAVGTATYTITPATTSGCPGSAITVVVTVNPDPVAPSVAKNFFPNVIDDSRSSTLVITLSNSNSMPASITSLTDRLPGDLDILSFPQNTCGGIVVVRGSTITLTGGAIPTKGSCTISAEVSACCDGVLTNHIRVGALQTSLGNNVTPACAQLTVCSSRELGHLQCVNQNTSDEEEMSPYIEESAFAFRKHKRQFFITAP